MLSIINIKFRTFEEYVFLFQYDGYFPCGDRVIGSLGVFFYLFCEKWELQVVLRLVQLNWGIFLVVVVECPWVPSIKTGIAYFVWLSSQWRMQLVVWNGLPHRLGLILIASPCLVLLSCRSCPCTNFLVDWCLSCRIWGVFHQLCHVTPLPFHYVASWLLLIILAVTLNLELVRQG